MDDTRRFEPVGRVTARFLADPSPSLTCSHCAGVITDDDAHCPTCDSPIDWGASFGALRQWSDSQAAS